MEKLTKENIYIDLRGKSKEQLTELYELVKDNLYKDFRENDANTCLEFYDNCWMGSINDDNKQEVTIEQLKEILQPMENKEEQLRKEAKERGYTHDNFKCLIYRKSKGIRDIDKWHYCNISDRLYTNVLGEGGSVVYENGVWAEIVSESLEQQLERAEAEVKRLKDLINAKDELKRIQKLIESLENER